MLTIPSKAGQNGMVDELKLQVVTGIAPLDMTPQQGSLSGVIICLAYAEGQRLRVNSFTTARIQI